MISGKRRWGTSANKIDSLIGSVEIEVGSLLETLKNTEDFLIDFPF